MTSQGHTQEYAWLAPYGLALVVLWVFYVLFRLYETWYANKTHRLLYRDLWVFRSLSRKQRKYLQSNFEFYNKLSSQERRRYEHRVVTFVGSKKFIGRDGLIVTEEMKLLIAAVGCMLTFGRKHYLYALVENILLYPAAFYSAINDEYHKGEFNPSQRTLVLSWEDFEKGYRITDDNLNLGIHEFMHALQLDAVRSEDVDAIRFERQFQKILVRLTDQDLKDKLDEVKYFRAYAFTNQYEFMAVLAEYFFESPNDFKTHFPILYERMRRMLNYDLAGY
ncbi:hypothetical protein EAX61_03845 [Dokdonia sinensis]|uniref:DgsA anti-repressor MtfA n=1 Tax=Dokdonia sinensis TaxID=2479847 RepID=A0A3M0GND7_9FLAO|nr:zinc-dependent peptidase [Dokdonia sinensis]RMB62719.1 hypothetical protein EAX61_03845 [Dokdonia sinensis]